MINIIILHSELIGIFSEIEKEASPTMKKPMMKRPLTLPPPQPQEQVLTQEQ